MFFPVSPIYFDVRFFFCSFTALHFSLRMKLLAVQNPVVCLLTAWRVASRNLERSRSQKVDLCRYF